MELSRIFFLSIVTLSIIGVSVLAAWIISIGLHFEKRGTLIALALGFLFPVLFILGMALGRTGSALKAITPIIAALSALVLVMIGISLLIALLIAFGLATGHGTSTVLVKGLLTLGLCGGIFGIIQTQFLGVKEYTVTLSSLPDSWNGRRVVLLSDTHYGLMIQKNAAERVVKKIEELDPDLILHAGDLFDGPDVDAKAILTPWKRLTASIPVFYASGNHEAYGPYEKFIDAAHASGFTVLTNSSTTYDGVTIAGIPYISKSDTASASSSLALALPEDSGNPTILINHHPTFLDTASAHGVDLMVSGHTHGGQFWPMRYLVRAVYGKYYYGKHSFGDMTVLTTKGTGFSGIPLRLFTTPEIVVITFEK